MTISLLEHPLGAQPGQPGDRSAFHFETITRLPSTASGLGRDGARYGRTGIIHTPHGDIRTPAFVPVGTQAAMKAVLPEQMKDLGAQCLLANAFHLFERPGEDVLDAAGGLARFMNWDGPTFTDSGGFQVMSLGVGFKKTLAMDVTGMKSDDIIAKGKERMAWVDEDGVTFKSPLNGDAHRFSAEISMGSSLFILLWYIQRSSSTIRSDRLLSARCGRGGRRMTAARKLLAGEPRFSEFAR